jgi:hypothetical protein
VLLPGRGFYIWGGYANCANYPPALKANGLYFSQSIIWDKQHPVLTRKDFMGAHEWCFYGWKEGAAHQYFGPANATDLWAIKKVNPQNMIHLTEKPVELASRAMQFSSRPGENVLDLFGGSGSTMIAAEQNGWPPTSRGPAWGPRGRSGGGNGYAPAKPNVPRPVFVNRASLPFLPISRLIAAYSVAAGVWPLGEVQ